MEVREWNRHIQRELLQRLQPHRWSSRKATMSETRTVRWASAETEENVGSLSLKTEVRAIEVT